MALLFQSPAVPTPSIGIKGSGVSNNFDIGQNIIFNKPVSIGG